MSGQKCLFLSRNMTRLREARGLTREEVCLKMNISLHSLTKWEESKTGFFPYSILARLCKLYEYYDIYKMLTCDIRFAFNPVPLPDLSKYRHVDIFEPEVIKYVNA